MAAADINALAEERNVARRKDGRANDEGGA